MDIFTEITNLIEKNTDIPLEENVLEWANKNIKNGAIYDIYIQASNAKNIDSYEEKEKIRKCVQIVLKRVKIPRSFLGFHYLEVILTEKYNQPITCKVYEEYAAKFGTKYATVERAIRYICDSYQKQLQSYFHTNYKITSKKLIYLLEHEVREELERCV